MHNITLSFQGFSVEWSALPENSQVALATLGFSTKIKNSIAGMKKAVLGEGPAPWSDDDIAAEAARLGLSTWGRDEATAKAFCDAAQREMFDAIVSGIAPASRRGSTPRMSDDEKLRHAIAVELLVAAAKAKGKELPKRSKPDEKAAFDAMLAKALENGKFAAAVDKEFNDRKKKANKAADGLDDLFA